MNKQAECVFCRIIDGSLSASVITQSDQLIVIKDIVPKAPIHYLIIAKEHINDLVSMKDLSLMASVCSMAQQLAKGLTYPASFQLITNNGSEAGQSVFHLHFHFLSGSYLYFG